MLKLSSIKNTAHVDFTDENLDNFSVAIVINLTAVREPLTPKLYADIVIDETTFEKNCKKNHLYEPFFSYHVTYSNKFPTN